MKLKFILELARYIRMAPAAARFTQQQIAYLADYCQAQNSKVDRARWIATVQEKLPDRPP